MLQAEMETIIGMLDHRVAVLKAELIKELLSVREGAKDSAKPKANLVKKDPLPETTTPPIGAIIRNRAGKKSKKD